MQPASRHNRDIWSGLILVAIGALAVAIARTYPVGTALRMGPGYFPSVVGGILVLLGLGIAIVGWRRGPPMPAGWSPRALLVLPLTIVLFGALVERAGFVPALVALTLGAAAAGREFRLAEALLLALLLTALSVAIFIWGLGLPYPLLTGV